MTIISFGVTVLAGILAGTISGLLVELVKHWLHRHPR